MEIEVIRPLTQSQRLDARQRAHKDFEKVLGPRPQPHVFKDYTVRDYPTTVLWIVMAIMCLFLIAAWIVSAMRLFDIAKNTFAQSIAHEPSSITAGIAIVLLAEIGQIGFTLSLAILNKDVRWGPRLALWSAAVTCTAIAVIGNFEKGIGFGNTASWFRWIETLAPPILVLISAYVFKEVVLTVIARHHANRKAYELALKDWERGMQDAESHREWPRIYANALISELRRRNTGKAAQEFWGKATGEDYLALVKRELEADQWYVRAQVPQALPAPIKPERPVDANRFRQNEDGYWIAICPICQMETEPKARQMSATRALSAHLKAHQRASVNGGSK